MAVSQEISLFSKEQGFTLLYNHAIRDKELSDKAVGLLAVMVSRPPSWQHCIKGYSKILKEGRDSIAAALKELENNGYLRRQQCHTSNGKFDKTIFVIDTDPKSGQDSDFIKTENSRIVNHSNHFTIIRNEALNDSTLSLKAKGLLIRMISLPPNWKFSATGLSSKTLRKEGRSTTLTTLKELESAGYLRRFQTRTEKGTLGLMIYEFEDRKRRNTSLQPQFENPSTVNSIDNSTSQPQFENPSTEYPEAEKPAQLIKEELSKEQIKPTANLTLNLESTETCGTEHYAETTLKHTSTPSDGLSKGKNSNPKKQNNRQREFLNLSKISVNKNHLEDAYIPFCKLLEAGYSTKDIKVAYKKYCDDMKAQGKETRYYPRFSSWLDLGMGGYVSHYIEKSADTINSTTCSEVLEARRWDAFIEGDPVAREMHWETVSLQVARTKANLGEGTFTEEDKKRLDELNEALRDLYDKIDKKAELITG